LPGTWNVPVALASGRPPSITTDPSLGGRRKLLQRTNDPEEAFELLRAHLTEHHLAPATAQETRLLGAQPLCIVSGQSYALGNSGSSSRVEETGGEYGFGGSDSHRR